MGGPDVSAGPGAGWIHARSALRTTIGHQYPSVEMVEVSLQFIDERSPDRAQPQTMRREPQHSALFRSDCPSRGCVNGGFDLDAPIHAMLRAGDHRTDGELVCQGTIGRRFRSAERCGCRLSFVGWAEYRSDKSANSRPVADLPDHEL